MPTGVAGPGLTRIEDRQDVRVSQLRGDSDFVQESLGADRRGEVGAHHLEGDEAIVAQVAGEVDGRHAALPELALDGIAAGQCVLDLIDGVRQSLDSAMRGYFARLTAKAIRSWPPGRRPPRGRADRFSSRCCPRGDEWYAR